MVELFEQDVRRSERQSSKGNQLKWESGSVWYKADYTGYEGLAEYLISHLLARSSLRQEEYVLYDLEQIRYKSVIYSGVKSMDFLKQDWQIITLERLFQNFFGRSLYRSIYQITDVKERLCFLTEQVERITGLPDFGRYMNKLFTIDALFLNEDRHTHNIAVLMNGAGRFAYCPFFDHGAGLLADTRMDYPMSGDVYQLMREVKAKTISSDFDEQLDLSELLYGKNLTFYFSEQDVRELLNDADLYSHEERIRVEQIICTQMQKYRYLF